MKTDERRQMVPVHLRAAHATVGFSAGQSILMQWHDPSRSGAICCYADGLVRAKIDAYENAMSEFHASNRNCRIGKRLEAFH
jgi:hypothetical protein